MRIALLIIILSKEKAGGSGFICLSVSLPSLACKALANILATQCKDPMSVLMSDVEQLSLVVVTGQHLMLGILQTCFLCPQSAVPSVLRNWSTLTDGKTDCWSSKYVHS